MKSSVINHKSTRRGCRAGAYKQRNVSVVIGNRPETSERKTYENIDEGIIKDNKITYNSDELLKIKNDIQNDRRYNIIDSEVYSRIKKLGINKKTKKSQNCDEITKFAHQNDPQEKQVKVNDKNLVHHA